MSYSKEVEACSKCSLVISVEASQRYFRRNLFTADDAHLQSIL